MITVGKWKVLVHTSKRGSVVAILSSTMAQFLKYADISCYLSACVVSFHVNKEAILLSIQIIKIFIFICSIAQQKTLFVYRKQGILYKWQLQ